MADIQYLNYGDLQIELLAFLNKAANEVQNYVQNQPWSRKRKEKFMSAYSDLMNRGVLGASNSSGQWVLDIGGDDLGLDSKDTKDKEMYQEAAYFILQQMAGMPTKSVQEEEEKKDLPVFDNKYFTEALHTKIGKDEFGGRDWDTQNDWNNLDARGENGLRSKNKRAATLSKHLQEYANSLEEGKYNFEGSPFADLNDFRARVENAVEALKNPDNEEGVTTALNRLGLRASDYFNNGSGDLSDTINPTTNQPFTYSELALYNQLQAEEKLKLLLLAQQLAKINAYNNALVLSRGSSKLQGRSALELKMKYQNDNNLIAALQSYSQLNISNLTPDELSELHGAYKNLATAPIDGKLLRALQSTPRYKGASPNRFRKINGVDGFIWDSAANLVIQILNRQQFNVNGTLPSQGLFNNVKTPEEILLNYMNSTEGGFTPAELREVAALLFDLVAAADPEGVSSTALSQVASGIRDYNRATDPEGWTWGDTGWATLDHGLGLLSLIPVAGGWVKGAWALSKLGKYLPKMEKAIRLMGRAGSTYAMASNAPGALTTLNKIKNGEDLSLKDYQDLAYFFIGGLGHHQLNRGNRVERTAMKARGIETSNSLLNKAGITRTKAKLGEKTPVLKVSKTKEDGTIETQEIPIDSKQLKILSKTKSQDLDAKAKDLGIKIPEGYKVQSKTSTTKTWSRENLNRYMGKAHSEIFGTLQPSTSSLNSKELFELYLSEHNNTWLKKIFNGSNRDIRRYDRNYLGNNPSTSESITKNVQSKELKSVENALFTPDRILRRETKAFKLNNHGNKGIRGDVEFEWEGLKFKYDDDSHILAILNGNKWKSIKGIKSLSEVKKYLADFIKLKYKITSVGDVTKKLTPQLIENIKELKRKGFLYKEGGTINKQKIQNYLNFINK